MIKYPLVFREGHYFLDVEGALWVLDTGAPSSFGHSPLEFAGQSLEISESYFGLDAAGLSDIVGVDCHGLLGTDILSNFDLLLDARRGELTVSQDELQLEGSSLDLADFMGIPIADVFIAGTPHRFFVDTGAQLSYFQDSSLETYPNAGRVADFYPGFGKFETETYSVPATIGNVAFQLRCGSLPVLLGATLMMAGTRGIIGNEILNGRALLIAPRRRQAVLSKSDAPSI